MKLAAIVTQPIPDHTQPRALKTGYRTYPLSADARSGEPLVDIAEYGIAGQSYYSRPNGATGAAVPGVPRPILLRKSIAERLATINYALQASAEVTELMGGRVELYVNEGVRQPAVQKQLYEQTFPALIQSQHPTMSAAEQRKLRNNMIAKPPTSGSTPPPHATGAAFDLTMRYVQPNNDFVAKALVDMGHANTEIGNVAWPDYLEHSAKLIAADKRAQRNRRIFYWVMRGALNHEDSGFAVNPTEWWHWSYGDQMWAKLTHAPSAFFGFAPDIDRK